MNTKMNFCLSTLRRCAALATMLLAIPVAFSQTQNSDAGKYRTARAPARQAPPSTPAEPIKSDAGIDALKAQIQALTEAVRISGQRQQNRSHPAQRSSLDSKLVTFPYTNQLVFEIRMSPNKFTNFEFSEDERLVSFVVSDEARWPFKETNKGNDLFVQPLEGAISVAAKIITNKRKYMLTLITVPEGEEWYQRVTWKIPDTLVSSRQQDQEDDTPNARRMHAPLQPTPQTVLPATAQHSVGRFNDTSTINVANLKPLTIEGTANFTPVQAFTDGKRAILYLREGADRPAVFAHNAQGEATLVQFLSDPNNSNALVINHPLPNGATLQIGKDIARVYPVAEKPSFWQRMTGRTNEAP